MKDLGHLSYFLDLEITHFTDGICITQAKYASEILFWAKLTDSKTVDTPVELNTHLTPSRGKSLSNPSLYKWLVGSLVYPIVTRPDISYVVHQLSQYLSALWLTHYIIVLCILWYLKGTLFHGIFYSSQSPLILCAFSDANWVRDPTDRRSTTGYCFLLGSSLISWRSKKQTLVFTKWVNIYLLYNWLTMLLLCAFFDTWKALSYIAFSTLLSLLLFSVHSLMLIGQDIPLIASLPLVIAFFLVLLWFLGEVRNKPLWPTSILKQNIVPLLIPQLNSFG